MSAIPKKKLCWNCEGRVAFSDENCPFCGVYLSSSSLINPQDPISTHTPPYRLGSENKSIPASPYGLNAENENNQDEETSEPFQETDSSQQNHLLPFIMLQSGSVFFIFGLILFVFSQQGTLTLQWNANYWFIYLGLAISFLFIGWRSLQNLK